MRPISVSYSAIEDLRIKAEECIFQAGTVLEIWGNK